MFGQLLQLGGNNAADFFGDGSGVSFYKFEGNLKDESGRYDGTINSGGVGVTYSTSIKKFGTQSLTFTQVGGLAYSHNPILFTNDGVNAVSYWGYLSAWPDDDSLIFNLNWRREANGNAFLQTDAVFQSIGRTFGIGAWRHVVITKDGTTVRVYINKVLEESWSNGGNLIYQQVNISKNTDAPLYFIDRVRTFNRDLTTSDIDLLYNETE